MKDILLDQDGDMVITKDGDFLLENSVRQKIRIRILWFLNEWQWDTDLGLPWFQELIGLKQPDIDEFEAKLREAIFNVDEITEVGEVSISINAKTRKATLRFTASTDTETIREEVTIDEQLRSNG